MFNSELQVNQLLMGYCGMLVKDLADERLAEQPHPGVNHPAWILGHLTFSAERARMLLGASKEMPPTLVPLFGPGTKPSPTRSDYASKEELLRTFEQSFEQLRRDAAAATSEQLTRPSENPVTKDILPTIQDVVAFLLTGHLGLHLGQLATWRRLIGLPPLF